MPKGRCKYLEENGYEEKCKLGNYCDRRCYLGSCEDYEEQEKDYGESYEEEER